MAGRMKDGPWERLLERAQWVGVDTIGYTPENADLLERRVDEKEVQRATNVNRSRAHDSGTNVVAPGYRNDSPEARLLLMHGLPVDQTMLQQLATFIRALQVFQERNAVYGDLWAQQPLSDSVHHIYHKQQRLEKLEPKIHETPLAEVPPDLMKAALDTALDCINYAAFFARLLAGKVPDTQMTPAHPSPQVQAVYGPGNGDPEG